MNAWQNVPSNINRDIAIGTWNTRALHHHQPNMRDKLREFSRKHASLALRGVMAPRLNSKIQLYQRRLDYGMAASIPSHTAGGAATILPIMTKAQFQA
eukprot:4176057-Pyramimonas_sp.AAC.1